MPSDPDVPSASLSSKPPAMMILPPDVLRSFEPTNTTGLLAVPLVAFSVFDQRMISPPAVVIDLVLDRFARPEALSKTSPAEPPPVVLRLSLTKILPP